MRIGPYTKVLAKFHTRIFHEDGLGVFNANY